MVRRPCCAKEGLNKGAWTPMEDKALTDYIKLHGEGGWRSLSERAGLKRCGKSCRLRWLNYLRPDIKRGNITADEEDLIIRLHRLLGNRWSLIAGRLPGRTDSEIKNFWNTTLRKKLQDHHQPRRESNAKRSNKKRTTKPQCPTRNVVIRPKAVKCTRVFINPQTSPPPPPLPPRPTPAPSTWSTEIMGPAHGTNNLVLSKGMMEGLNLEDFLEMDFSMMGELNFSEFLDSPQILDVCYELSQGKGNKVEQFSQAPLLKEPAIFPEKMVEGLQRSGCVGVDTSVVEYLLGE